MLLLLLRRLSGSGILGRGVGRVEGVFEILQCGARPGVLAQVKRVLMSLHLVLILEPILADRAHVLLL